jgi:hypothetical protein
MPRFMATPANMVWQPTIILPGFARAMLAAEHRR